MVGGVSDPRAIDIVRNPDKLGRVPAVEAWWT